MALSTQDLEQIESLLGRSPSQVETHIFDTMWSEHCSYKSSKSLLKQFPTSGDDVIVPVGEDAGIVSLTVHDDVTYCLAVSHESHNHPSQILPIEGAATGVGGCVRDVFCMGADVIGVLNSLHFGIPQSTTNALVEEISEKVVQGVGDYANPLGVPVLGGETLYHDSYNENCLVNVAAIGIVEKSKIIHSFAPPEAKEQPYDVILFGKSTDATGFGGASFSSATLDHSNDQVNIGAVQVHDPFIKRVLVSATNRMLEFVYQNAIPIGFKDLGAGGISCATSEIAIGGGFGVEIDLDCVNVAISGLPSEVIACSETQERYCVVVPQKFTQNVLDIFNDQFQLPKLYPNAGARVIGQITSNQRYVIKRGDKLECDLPIKAITTEVTAKRTMQKRDVPKLAKSYTDQLSPDQFNQYCIHTLSEINNRSKRFVYTRFDHSVKGNTIIYPGEADAVVISPIPSSTVGIGVSIDSNLYGHVDPYVSGSYAVAESIRNVVSVGAKPIALTDCLNYGNPEKPSVFFDFDQGIKGISDAASHLNFSSSAPIPIISGNVSFYNESKSGKAVIPSPVVVCLGRVENFYHARTMQLKSDNLELFLLGLRYPEFGGTQFQSKVPQCGVAPQVRFDEENACNEAVHSLISRQLLSNVHDISMGGLWQTLVEMVIGERGRCEVGLKLDFGMFDSLETTLFSENGGYVIALNPEKRSHVASILEELQVPFFHIGHTNQTQSLEIQFKDRNHIIPIQDIIQNWNLGQR